MRGDPQLNGCDYLMRGFDYELRRQGYAGNSCQIILELGSAISPEALRGRLAFLINRHPILASRVSGWLMPRWKTVRANGEFPHVRQHRDNPGLREKLANEPLAIESGELLRFDLIERAGGRMDVIFTWSHTLMDANSAEHFLAIVGRDDLPLPCEERKLPLRPRKSLLTRLALGRKSVLQFDRFCEAQPRTVGVRFPSAPAAQRYRVLKFSTEETAAIRAHGVRLCGPLGDAQFHAAVALLELHRLHQRLELPSASYILPVPVSLRAKGSVEPLFCNQVTMMMTQFLPSQLGSVADAVAALKAQTAQNLREGLIESGVTLSELSRFLPLPFYTALVKRGLRGEICSLFYGNVSAVTPLLTAFLGANIEEFVHIGAVTPSPGLGVIFFYFRGALRVTVFHLERHFTVAETGEFAASLRARLLNP